MSASRSAVSGHGVGIGAAVEHVDRHHPDPGRRGAGGGGDEPGHVDRDQHCGQQAGQRREEPAPSPGRHEDCGRCGEHEERHGDHEVEDAVAGDGCVADREGHRRGDEEGRAQARGNHSACGTQTSSSGECGPAGRAATRCSDQYHWVCVARRGRLTV